MWVCYPLVPFFATAFGFFLTHYPKGGCWWLGFWLTYMFSTNVLYNLPFTFIHAKTMVYYWFVVAASEIAMLFFMWKTQAWTKKDKTFHLIWEAPLFGGFLCGVSWMIMAQNSPHSRATFASNGTPNPVARA